MREKSIHIYDLDGTIINSNAAARACQIDGLLSLSGKKGDLEARLSMESRLDELGLRGAVESFGSSMDNFFKKHYVTFDPHEARKKGSVYTFPDAIEAMKFYADTPKIIISNFTIAATSAKLDAFGLSENFKRVYAEYSNGRSKPNTYMGEQALDYLSSEGLLSGNPRIVMVGDMDIDLQFGKNIKNLYPNAVNLLIDRKGDYSGSVRPDKTIRSLTEMED